MVPFRLDWNHRRVPGDELLDNCFANYVRTSAIVWVVDPGTNVLHAYDATNLSNELYSSQQNSTRDALGSHVKFAPVTVVNGTVYVGTKTQIVGYGLLP
jgi:hypothetical protein